MIKCWENCLGKLWLHQYLYTGHHQNLLKPRLLMREVLPQGWAPAARLLQPWNDRQVAWSLQELAVPCRDALVYVANRIPFKKIVFMLLCFCFDHSCTSSSVWSALPECHWGWFSWWDKCLCWFSYCLATFPSHCRGFCADTEKITSLGCTYNTCNNIETFVHFCGF